VVCLLRECLRRLVDDRRPNNERAHENIEAEPIIRSVQS
jgi:hypothetical protein